ncbi:hypothetical protein Tco_0494867 [Tanacetum coccineum]
MKKKKWTMKYLTRSIQSFDWKTQNYGTKPQLDEAKTNKEINLNVVTRSNGQKRHFSVLTSVLSIFDREDLNAVYQLVMNKLQMRLPGRSSHNMLTENEESLKEWKYWCIMLNSKLESEEESFQDDAKYEHVSQDTRSQGGKDIKEKDLKISEQKTNSKDNDKGLRSKITRHEGTSPLHDKDQRFRNSMIKQSQEVQGSKIQDLTSEI